MGETVDESLKADRLADERRRRFEAEERLAVAKSKTCPSCNAEFSPERGGAVGKKPVKDKEKAEGAQPPPKTEVEDSPAKAAAEAEAKDRGWSPFGMFEPDDPEKG